jgi:hypothetical protein
MQKPIRDRGCVLHCKIRIAPSIAQKHSLGNDMSTERLTVRPCVRTAGLEVNFAVQNPQLKLVFPFIPRVSC